MPSYLTQSTGSGSTGSSGRRVGRDEGEQNGPRICCRAYCPASRQPAACAVGCTAGCTAACTAGYLPGFRGAGRGMGPLRDWQTPQSAVGAGHHGKLPRACSDGANLQVPVSAVFVSVCNCFYEMLRFPHHVW